MNRALQFIFRHFFVEIIKPGEGGITSEEEAIMGSLSATDQWISCYVGFGFAQLFISFLFFVFILLCLHFCTYRFMLTTGFKHENGYKVMWIRLAGVPWTICPFKAIWFTWYYGFM